MIKVFSFVGSCAGKDGHTVCLSDAIAKAIQKQVEAEGEKMSYECLTGADLRVDYCRSCSGCFQTGVCPQDVMDDMAVLKKKMFVCDILLFGSPVYMGRMSGLTKSVIDRLAYWSHRFELLGKPCIQFVTTHSNHGKEASEDLEYIMRFFGTSLVNAGPFYIEGYPNLHLESDMEPTLTELAKRILAVYHDPRIAITDRQQSIHFSLILQGRKTLRLARAAGKEVRDEVRVCERRGLLRYVLMSEAIEDLCMKPDGAYYREKNGL